VRPQLIPLVQQFNVGKTGKHDNDRPFSEFLLMDFLKNGNPVIRLHDQVQKNQVSVVAPIPAARSKKIQKRSTSFERVNLIEELTLIQGAPLGVQVRLGVINKNDL
jgi:hypothetical protein